VVRSAPPRITLLTDFGTADGYVGAVKGVLSQLCPDALLIDITHDIPPGDVRAGAFALMTATRTFPRGTVHLAVVDPGVGTERSGLLVEAGGALFVGPDNGLLSLASAGSRRVFVLDRPSWFQHPVSPTFHGRDVFAPIAARAAAGVLSDELGTSVSGMLEIEIPPARHEPECVCGEVFHVDRFGNLVTTIRDSDLAAEGRERLEAVIGTQRIPLRATYGQAPEGVLIALIGSSGFVEVARVGGSAAAVLAGDGRTGAPVRLMRAA